MDAELVSSPRSKDMDAELVKDVDAELLKDMDKLVKDMDAELVKPPRSQPGQYFSPSNPL